MCCGNPLGGSFQGSLIMLPFWAGSNMTFWGQSKGVISFGGLLKQETKGTIKQGGTWGGGSSSNNRGSGQETTTVVFERLLSNKRPASHPTPPASLSPGGGQCSLLSASARKEHPLVPRKALWCLGQGRWPRFRRNSVPVLGLSSNQPQNAYQHGLYIYNYIYIYMYLLWSYI